MWPVSSPSVSPSLQATGGYKPAERGHRATEEAAGQEEASEHGVPLPLGGLHLWTQAAQNQGCQWQWFGPLPQALPAPAVSLLKQMMEVWNEDSRTDVFFGGGGGCFYIFYLFNLLRTEWEVLILFLTGGLETNCKVK